MNNDAVRLFNEDRQRFLTLYREFLSNSLVSDTDKIEVIESTPSVIRQIAELIGPKRGE